MKIYAIDQSLNALGHCMVEDGTPLFSATVDSQKLRGMARMEHLLQEVCNQIEAGAPDVIVLEDYAYSAGRGGSSSIIQLAELGGCIKLEIHRRGYEDDRDTLLRGSKVFMVQGSGQMKKFCLGNGSTKKDSNYMLTVFDKMKRRFANDNEADAYMHAHLAAETLGVLRGTTSLSSLITTQREALIAPGAKAKGISLLKAMKFPEAEMLKLIGY